MAILLEDRSPQDQATDQWRLLRGGLAPGETVRLAMRTGSMAPLIPPGAEIEVAAAVGGACRVGEVVVFRRGDRLVAHRLLFGWGHDPGGWFLERGDGVSAAGVIRPREILGRVVAVHPREGGERRLDGPEAGAAALREARRSLARFVLASIGTPLRKARRWLRRDSTGSA